MVKKHSGLERKCEKALKEIAQDIRKIKNHLASLRDIDQKVSHVLTELREDYYYGVGLRNFFDDEIGYRKEEY